MNGDGKTDLVTGCFEGGIYVLDGLGGGRFAEPRRVLDKEGAWLRLGEYWDDKQRKWTTVAASTFSGSTFSGEHGISATPVDWDDDGDLDLLLGARSGAVFVRINEGTTTKPAYATQSQQVQAAGENLRVPGDDAMVITADWDSDGRWDILAGSGEGFVSWFRNVGSAGAPKFAAPEILVPGPGNGRETKGEQQEVATRPGFRVQIEVGDHNGDGRPDLLVGDYRSVMGKAPDLSPEQTARRDALRRESEELDEKISAQLEKHSEEEEQDWEKLLESDADLKKLCERSGEVRKELAPLEPQRSWHGFVWLYLRKPAAPGR
ncbi:MAG: VCBS repeat-containing protein [Planctomycetota bacterium]